MTRVTIRMLAEELGLSPTAVSHALHNRSNISVATRERVRAKAAEMGYRPNAMVQALMADLRTRGRSGELMPLAIAFPKAKMIEGHSWLFPAMDQQAEALGYRVERFWGLGDSLPPSRLLSMLRARGIRGLILPPGTEPDVFPPGSLNDFAMASFNYSTPENKMHRASLHHSADMDTMLGQLFQRGFKRPGFIVRELTDRITRHCWLGRFLSTLWDKRMPCEDAALRLAAGGDTFLHITEWLARYRPDCLIAGNQETLDDLDAYFGNGHKWIPTAMMNLWSKGGEQAGIEQNLDGVACEAVRLVVDQLNLGQGGLPESPRTVLLPGRWREGASLGDKPVPIKYPEGAVRHSDSV